MKYFPIILVVLMLFVAVVYENETASPYKVCEDRAYAKWAEMRANECRRFNFGLDCNLMPSLEEQLQSNLNHEKNLCLQLQK